MVYSVTKRFKFEAAHQLPNHDGQCRMLHGHSYVVEVIVAGTPLGEEGDPKEGMVLDFSMLSDIVDPIIKEMDHKFLSAGDELCRPNLGSMVYEVGRRTTAENIAAHLFWRLHADMERKRATSKYFQRASLDGVRVYETATSWAEYRQ